MYCQHINLKYVWDDKLIPKRVICDDCKKIIAERYLPSLRKGGRK